MDNNSHIALGVLSLIEDSRDLLSQKDVLAAQELLEHNEWGEAYLLIVVQLYEFEVSIDRSLFEKIELLGREMQLDSAAWEPLRGADRVNSIRHSWGAIAHDFRTVVGAEIKVPEGGPNSGRTNKTKTPHLPR